LTACLGEFSCRRRLSIFASDPLPCRSTVAWALRSRPSRTTSAI
jgi:hypothetical protein